MTTRLPHGSLFSFLLGACALVAVNGCSDDSGSKASTGDDDDTATSSSGGQGGGIDRGDGGAVTADTNPYGVAYPTEGLGTKPRGVNPGDKIRNFKFQGYPDGKAAASLAPMKMADYYDPELRNNVKLIHIQASGVWCVYCRQESDDVAPKIKEWRDKGIVYILSMAEGSSNNIPAESKDLDKWLKDHNLVTPAWLDSGNQQLGIFYDAAAMPWNATIDATTMEIISSNMGADPERAAGMEAKFDKYIAEIDARAATK